MEVVARLIEKSINSAIYHHGPNVKIEFTGPEWLVPVARHVEAAIRNA